MLNSMLSPEAGLKIVNLEMSAKSGANAADYCHMCVTFRETLNMWPEHLATTLCTSCHQHENL